MFEIDALAFYLGIALCAVSACTVVWWFGQSMIELAGSKHALQESARAMREAIRLRSNHSQAIGNEFSWSGYRDFVVTKLVRECSNVVSVYLEAEDGKPIPGFIPGQHITVKFQPKGKPKPLVRCYSLSNAPGDCAYRITVKHVVDQGDNKGPGVVSTIINCGTQVGDRIAIKAPSGHFCLDQDSSEVIVLLAGGIGITPMISMLEHLIATNDPRSIVLFHGVRSKKEQPFNEFLNRAASTHENVHVVNCYSRPEPNDVFGVDFHVEGFVSIDLLKSILPGKDCQYFLCGPPAFMKSLHSGLEAWGVEKSNIQFEQFGPSTIRKVGKTDEANHDEPDPVSFLESGEVALWNSRYESLLELAEANDIPIESGCRAGSCGTCETAVVSGKVRYTTTETASCNPGCCLPCVSIPDGPLELEV